MNQKDYWNNVADSKTFTTPFQQELFSQYVCKEACILDVGCGYGRVLNELHAAGFTNLHGLDFSKDMIQRGKSLFPDIDLQVMESGKINAPDQSVDAVILFAVLTCISSNEDQQALIKEIHRVLKPDGILYVNDFLLNTDDRNLARYKEYEPIYHTYGVFKLPEGAILRHHSEEWIKNLLQPFTKKTFEHLTFTTMNGHTSNGFFFIGENKLISR